MTNYQLENKIIELEKQLKCKVQRYATLEDFPVVGSTCPLYLDLATDTLYYWDGNSYEAIGAGGGAGDNLGNHIATQDLDMDGNNIIGTGYVEGSGGLSILSLSNTDSSFLSLSSPDESNYVILNSGDTDARIRIIGLRPTLTDNDVLRKDEIDANYLASSITKAQLNTAVSDGNVVFVGDTISGVWNTAGNTSIAGLTLGSTDNTALTISAGTAAININAATTGAVNIANSNSSTGAIGIGNGNSNQTLNIGTSVGSGNKILNIGSTIGTSYTTINSSSSGMDLASGSNTFIRATGSTTLSIASLGAVTSTINIGAIAGTSTLNVMNTGSGNKTVSIGSTVGSSATTLRSGSGNVNINDAGTGGVLIGTSTSAQTINIGDAAGAKTTTLGSTNTTSTTTINAGSGGLGYGGLTTVTGGTSALANAAAVTASVPVGKAYIWDDGDTYIMCLRK